MTNVDRDPQETFSRAGETGPGIEVLVPRNVPLGGLRGMNVRRVLPQRARSLIGAWCFLDHYGPDDVAVTGGMNVAAHPHTGLQTVSWLFSGEIEHRDSAGFHALVKPGELNLMTSGKGISHSERSTPNTTTLHGVQLWVALPDNSRNGEKTFDHYAPQVTGGSNWRGQVFVGSLFGDESPVFMHTPIVGAELNLDAGASLTIDLDPSFEHGVMVDAGTVRMELASPDFPTTDNSDDICQIGKDELAYAPPGARRMRLTAGEEPVRLIFIGGEPFPEEIVMWWNFIGRSHQDIVEARADWQSQLDAAGVGDPADKVAEQRGGFPGAAWGAGSPGMDSGRFGLPADEPEPPLPAPPLPNARIVPRKQPAPRSR